MTNDGIDKPPVIGVLTDGKVAPECPLQHYDFAALKADLAEGLADLAAGRVKDFDADRIIERGRKLLAAR